VVFRRYDRARSLEPQRRDRVVLIFDLWSPYLSEAERAALAVVIEISETSAAKSRHCRRCACRALSAPERAVRCRSDARRDRTHAALGVGRASEMTFRATVRSG